MFKVEVTGVKGLQAKLAEVGGYCANTYDWGKVVAQEAWRPLVEATATWEHRPRFDITQRGASGGIGGKTAYFEITANPALPFGYVNAGTRPHMIFPKKPGGVLAFNSRFSAKSRPNSLKAYVGSSRGPVRFARGVHHPGFPARNYDKLAIEKAKREGSKIVKAQLERIIARRTAMGL